MIDEALDIIGYIIPIPFLYIGSILHIDLQDPMVYFMYASSMNVNILFAELVLLLVSLLVFVFYLYPRDLAYKGVRLLRIVITAAMWLAMNAHILYGGYIPEFILSLVPTVFPTYQGNLAYIYNASSFRGWYDRCSCNYWCIGRAWYYFTTP